MVVTKVKIPQIEEVDFTDAMAVSDFGHMLLSAFRNAGGVNFGTNRGKKILEIEYMAQQYVSKVADQILEASADEIMRYLSWYDLTHRIGLHTPAPTSFMVKWIEETFKRYKRGEKCDVNLMLSIIVHHDMRLPSTLDAKVLYWAKQTVEELKKEFNNGKLFAEHTLKDALAKTLILQLSWNRSEFTKPDSPQLKLINKFNILVNNIEKETDPDLLQYLTTIVSLQGIYVDQDKADKDKERIFSRLIEIDNSSKFLKAAIQLDFEFEKSLRQ